jgi:hypothetical protein
LLNIASDEWIPFRAWEATFLAHKETFANILETVLTNESPDHDEPTKDERNLREIWPFDLDSVW